MLAHAPFAVLLGSLLFTAACGSTTTTEGNTSSGSTTSGATTGSGSSGGTTAGAGGGTTGAGGGSGATTAGAGGSGTTTAGAGGGSTSTGAGGAAPEVKCAVSPPVFPTFDRTCSGASDCVVAFHQINCCGTRRAMGIAKGELAAFGQAEAVCESQYPGCGCAQQPTAADDGNSTFDESSIQVTCLMGNCSTFVP